MRTGWWRAAREIYLTVDPRSLGAFRITLGLVLLSDLARRWAELDFWYVNSGLLPNHTLLWRPPAQHLFSLLFGVSHLGEARFAFALCGLVYVLFLFGYRTRWLHFFALIARVSLNSRLAVLENGGDMVMNLLCLLSLPLPLGARFSLDAVALARREQRSGAVAEPLPHFVPESAKAPVVSLAVAGLLLQFATIYYFNAASKGGAAWRDGSAVHYALHQDKLVTWLGVWMRENLPPDVIRVLTRSVLFTEWAAVGLILTPFSWQAARLLAVCSLPALHLGFALGLNVGGFSPAMMSFYPFLLTAAHWDALEERFGEKGRRLWSRIEARFGRALDWVPVPRQLGFPALRQALWTAGTSFVLIAITSEVLTDNKPVPQFLRPRQPAWAKAVIEYPRVLQGWRMFAPEPSRMDSMIYVEAKTAAGKVVDPYNEVASDKHYPAGDVVPTHLGQSQFFVMYSERIPNEGYAAYRQAFSEWLLAYPERTGQEQDCLVRYDVYFVTDQSPPFGTREAPRPAGRQLFMSYRAPYNGPCREIQQPSPSNVVSSGLDSPPLN